MRWYFSPLNKLVSLVVSPANFINLAPTAMTTMVKSVFDSMAAPVITMSATVPGPLLPMSAVAMPMAGMSMAAMTSVVMAVMSAMRAVKMVLMAMVASEMATRLAMVEIAITAAPMNRHVSRPRRHGVYRRAIIAPVAMMSTMSMAMARSSKPNGCAYHSTDRGAIFSADAMTHQRTNASAHDRSGDTVTTGAGVGLRMHTEGGSQAK